MVLAIATDASLCGMRGYKAINAGTADFCQDDTRQTQNLSVVGHQTAICYVPSKSVPCP